MRSVVIVFAIAANAAAFGGCCAILGIGDLPPKVPAPDGGSPDVTSPDSDLLDRAIPKGDGPPCRFDDPGSRFDGTCTFDS